MDRLSSRYETVKRFQSITTVSRADTALKVLTMYHDDEDLIYTVFAVGFDAGSLSPVLRNGFEALSLPLDTSSDQHSDYYAIIDGGQLTAQEQTVTDWKAPLTYDGKDENLRIHLQGGSADQEEMTLNGTDCTSDQSGLRIAVYSKSEHRLLDCITFNYDGSTVTHGKEAGN